MTRLLDVWPAPDGGVVAAVQRGRGELPEVGRVSHVQLARLRQGLADEIEVMEQGLVEQARERLAEHPLSPLVESLESGFPGISVRDLLALLHLTDDGDGHGGYNA